MRGLRKGISAVLTAALVLTAVPVNGNNQVYAAEETAVDATVKVLPDQASTFHDTDNDGLGYVPVLVGEPFRVRHHNDPESGKSFL